MHNGTNMTNALAHAVLILIADAGFTIRDVALMPGIRNGRNENETRVMLSMNGVTRLARRMNVADLKLETPPIEAR